MSKFTAPTPITELWKTARAWLAEALDVFGGPHRIQHTLDRITQRTIKRQLQALQILAMKLLLIAAAHLAPSESKMRRMPRRGQGRLARIIDPARPETWRVSFYLHIPPEPEDTSAPRIRSLGPSRFIRAIVLDAKAITKRLAFLAAPRASCEARAQANAERLARRFEALRRIFANPMPSARRLKRKLLARKRGAFAAAARIAALKPPRRQLDPVLLDRAEYAAQFATPAFAAFDSS
ncbi:MAG: hypothetical protein R3C30_00340 [Hyphomonadaceae bacterium]